MLYEGTNTATLQPDHTLPPVADARPSNPQWGILALTVFGAMLVYLLGNNSTFLWDRDEPRYAQCSKQMLTGYEGVGPTHQNAHEPGLLVPHFLNDLRTQKPPLIYWLQSTSMRIFGQNSFAARFPSSVSMLLVLLLLGWSYRQVVSSTVANWAVFIMATSALSVLAAKMCLTDATLLLWTTVAQICCYAIYRGNRSWKVVLPLWIALGLGGLTKGPIILATVECGLLSLMFLDYFLDRKWNFKFLLSMQPIAWMLILVVIIGPWIVLIHKKEPTFLPRLMGAASAHLTSDTNQHSGPPGFYLALIWALFFPWSLLLPTAITIAIKNRNSPIHRFCIGMTLGIWIFQEIMKTKLPFYILPTFPALSLLTADAIDRCIRKEHDDLHRRIFKITAHIFGFVIIAMGLVGWLMYRPISTRLFHLDPEIANMAPIAATFLLSAIAIVFAWFVIDFFRKEKIKQGALTLGIGALCIFCAIFSVYLPRAEYLKTPMRIAEMLKDKNIGPGDGVMLEYKEPSLAFYQGGTLIESEIKPIIRDSRPTWIIAPRDVYDDFPAELKNQLEIVGKPVKGLNYVGKIKGKSMIEILVLKRK